MIQQESRYFMRFMGVKQHSAKDDIPKCLDVLDFLVLACILNVIKVCMNGIVSVLTWSVVAI